MAKKGTGNSYRFLPPLPILLSVGLTTMLPTTTSARCLMAAYLIPPRFSGLRTWSTTAAPRAALATLVPFVLQGICSVPTFINATPPAWRATFAASSHAKSSHGIFLDFGFPRCRLLLDRLLTGRGRALVRVRYAELYEDPARFICGRRTAFK